jgi:SAM-dependent methyltransferase
LAVSGIDREKGDSEMLQGIDVRLSEDFENNLLPFGNESFDIVFSKSVIEHIREPRNFMKETCRVLKPGGRVITMTPDWHSQIYIFYDDPTHVHPYTSTGLKDLFAMYGFKESASELFYQLPVLWKYPLVKIFSKSLQLLGPVKRIYKNKFMRWSRELMILATGVK